MLFFNWYKSINISFQQMLLYGVHIGHSFYNSWVYSGWLIYTYYQNILFINLLKTWKSWQLAVQALDEVTYNRQPIWFVNFDATTDHFIKYSAVNCAEYYITSNWIHGLASNYVSFLNIFYKYSFGHRAWNSNRTIFKKGVKNFYTDTWGLGGFRPPKLFFISNVKSSYKPTKEAFHAGAPSVGIVDTNTRSQVSTLPIPGNDDALDCIVFYNEFVSYYVLYRKFFSVLSWYHSVRKNKRVFSFNTWLKKKLMKKKRSMKSMRGDINKIFYGKNINSILSYGIHFFLSQNILLSGKKESISIYSKKIVTKKIDYLQEFVLDTPKYEFYNILFFMATYSYNWLNGEYLQEHYQCKRYFYRKFLKHNFFYLKLLRNRFYHSLFVPFHHRQDPFVKWTLKYFILDRYFKVLDTTRVLCSRFLFKSFYLRFVCLFTGIFLYLPWESFDLEHGYKHAYDHASIKQYHMLKHKFKNFKKRYFFIWDMHANLFHLKKRYRKHKKLVIRFVRNKSKFIKDISNMQNYVSFRLFNILNKRLGTLKNILSRRLEKQSDNVEYFFRLQGSLVSDILHNVSMAKIENKNYTIYNNNTLNYISKDNYYYRYMYLLFYFQNKIKGTNMNFISIFLINLIIDFDVVFFTLFYKNIKINMRYKTKTKFEWGNMKYKKHNFGSKKYINLRKKYTKEYLNDFL